MPTCPTLANALPDGSMVLFSNLDDPTIPPPRLLTAGFHPEDLALWVPAFQSRPAADGTADLHLAWSVLGNYLTSMANHSPDLPVHDALAWLIADTAAADLFDGPRLLAAWDAVTTHGWIGAGAGITPHEYATGQYTHEALRVLSGLRGLTLPPIRT